MFGGHNDHAAIINIKILWRDILIAGVYQDEKKTDGIEQLSLCIWLCISGIDFCVCEGVTGILSSKLFSFAICSST